MVRTGLYQPGGDLEADAAVETHAAIDAFASLRTEGVAESFAALAGALREAPPGGRGGAGAEMTD
jgi:flagellum-specific ATP synthase